MTLKTYLTANGYGPLNNDRAIERIINERIDAIRLTLASTSAEASAAHETLAAYMFERDMLSSRYDAAYEAGYVIEDFLAAL